jgi:hypothetical protein
MAAIENIIAWAKHEQARLAHQLEELQSGRLRTYEKHPQPPGWFEVDTTEHTIELNRLYISELNAIIARYPEVEPTIPAAPPPAPRFVPPAWAAAPIVEPVEQSLPRNLLEIEPQPDWIEGWGVVTGQPPRWSLAGLYANHAEANLAVAEAGEGYYARWGSYNFGSREFSSGTNFERL